MYRKTELNATVNPYFPPTTKNVARYPRAELSPDKVKQHYGTREVIIIVFEELFTSDFIYINLQYYDFSQML